MSVTPEAEKRNKMLSAARVTALRELAKLHPDDFARLRDEARERMGLPPSRQWKNRQSKP